MELEGAAVKSLVALYSICLDNETVDYSCKGCILLMQN